MYLAIVVLPLLGSVAAGCTGFFIGRQGAALLTVVCMLAAACVSLVALRVVLCGDVLVFDCGGWISVPPLVEVRWTFLLDPISMPVASVVLVVSLFVHLYSLDYMSGDPHLPRFMSYLSLFTFFMLVLVTSGTFLQLFLGWEGVGLCSYLLVNFWFNRVQANKAALKAMLVNRIGDSGLMVGIALLFYLFRTFDFGVLFSSVALHGQSPALTMACAFLFVGVVGKSAQIGLHTWLPDAMEGPTPVSALIHAATMVTAGVFLFVRCGPLFEAAPAVLALSSVVGAVTVVFAASIGIVQNDLKKIIAYSTCSQLGYMVVACSLSFYQGALFHLLTHAFFKALLFLAAGSIIHSVSDEQDLRRMGNLAERLPVTYMCLLVGSLALIGGPFLSGYFSKDFIAAVSTSTYLAEGPVVGALLLVGIVLTVVYSVRMLFVAMLGCLGHYNSVWLRVGEAGPLLLGVVVSLALLSLLGGWVAKHLIDISTVSPVWGGMDYEWEGLSPLLLFFLPLLIGWLTLCYYYFFCGNFLPRTPVNLESAKQLSLGSGSGRRLIYAFLCQRWFVDTSVNVYTLKLLRSFYLMYAGAERGCFEYIGPTGLARAFYRSAKLIALLNQGRLRYHMASVIFGVIILFSVVCMGWI